MVTITVGVTPVTMGTGKDTVLGSITLHIVKPCLCEERRKEGGKGSVGMREGQRREIYFSREELLRYKSNDETIVYRVILIIHSKDSIPFPLLTGPNPSPNVE